VLLNVENLEVSYGGPTRALRGVTLNVDEGEVVAVVGSNGAGKTTLMRAVSRTLRLEGGRVVGGRIVFGGKDISRSDPADIVRDGIVQVPEGRRIFARLTVGENLRVGGFTTKGKKAQREAEERVMELFPWIKERLRERAVLLSGGQQQMLAIGRALMAQPRLLLLDEPSLGLAPIIVSQVADVIKKINADGTSILLVEQNTAMALNLASRVTVMATGDVVLAGSADELAASGEIERYYLGIEAPTPAPAGAGR
jgi:branched-chain amino acid transport system ATP-binding protein